MSDHAKLPEWTVAEPAEREGFADSDPRRTIHHNWPPRFVLVVDEDEVVFADDTAETEHAEVVWIDDAPAEAAGLIARASTILLVCLVAEENAEA